jgi:integrase
MPSITTKSLKSAKPELSPYFIRDNRVKGFAVKVNASGSMMFIAEVWHKGRSIRKTLGEHPIMSVSDARNHAISFIQKVRQGKLNDQKKQLTLGDLFWKYIENTKLKPSTIKNYKHVVLFYLSDWLSKPISLITKEMVEAKFHKIRDKGINGGKPTLSQAVSSMRYLSSLMNYAMADELIESNPVDVLKQKRIDRSIRKREHYLPAPKVRELLDKTLEDDHPVTLAIWLMLYTGLRKNEALRLTWSQLERVNGVKCLVIGDTKNHRVHHVPITETIQGILDRARNNSAYLFPSTQKKNHYINDVRPTLNKLTKLIDMDFKCHDLRRTFATRAAEVGIDYLTIKRLLNHKSNDITGQYIQWNSRANLEVMRNALERIQY